MYARQAQLDCCPLVFEWVLLVVLVVAVVQWEVFLVEHLRTVRRLLQPLRKSRRSLGKTLVVRLSKVPSGRT